MNRARVSLAILALASTLALAAPTPAPLDSVRGQVISVDLAIKTIVARIESPNGDSQQMSFVLDDASRVVKDGANVPVRDLKPDDTVVVTYRAEGDKNVVVTITLSSKT